MRLIRLFIVCVCGWCACDMWVCFGCCCGLSAVTLLDWLGDWFRCFGWGCWTLVWYCLLAFHWFSFRLLIVCYCVGWVGCFMVVVLGLLCSWF